MQELMTAQCRADARLEDLPSLITEFLAVLNDKELERRREVNSHHFGQYGRLLYPEGGQGATYSLDRPGRRFVRVVQTIEGGDRSVHCFVELATGAVLKAAGWKAPAAGARFSLLDGDSRELLFARCEFTGSYLYRNAR